MKKITSITIIGCGRRVRQDVVAAALASKVSPNKIQILASQKRTILIRDKIFKVQKLSESSVRGDWVYFAVPAEKVKVLYLQNKSKFKGKKIIIDTPIIDKNLKKYINNPLLVAEDTYPLLKKIIKPNLNFRKFNFLFFQKSFFSYHGICFVQTILGKIRFMINLPFLKFFFAKKGIALIVGERNYEIGKITFNLNLISFPKLNLYDIYLIGGKTDFDTFSYRFLDLKRLGLKELFKNPREFIFDEALNYYSGLFQYNLSKKLFYLKLK
jgi:hypothetical protein